MAGTRLNAPSLLVAHVLLTLNIHVLHVAITFLYNRTYMYVHTHTYTHTHIHAPTQIQKQVHPRLEIDDNAVAYLEELIYRLLAQMCAAQPHTMADIEAYVQQNFAAPIDTWALSDAQLMMERLEKHPKRKGVFVFNVDKIFQQLQKVRGTE